MELPHLGKQCMHKSCNKLDFLPITCDACKNIFCEEHYTYARHDCPAAYLKNNQVPVCPLCAQPVPIARGQQPDAVVGAHIDNDCQSDPARTRRGKVFTNRCTRKGCKNKEFIPVVCGECQRNFCLRHRHPQDHDCGGKPPEPSLRERAFAAALGRHQPSQLSEDEQLARALALSMQENQSRKTQEDADRELARQLQAMESTGRSNRNAGGGSRNDQRCAMQ